MRHASRVFLAALCACSLTALAADPPATTPDELDALGLADRASPTEDKAARPWRVFIEGAGVASRSADLAGRSESTRASIDARVDASLAPGLRVVLSDRLDLVRDNAEPPVENVNTLREAYLSWARTDSQNFDFGRVNVRHGAALGYNPTDWFKEICAAGRGLSRPRLPCVRIDKAPSCCRASSCGRMAASPSRCPHALQRDGVRLTPSALSLDLGANNSRHRWLLAGSWRLAQRLDARGSGARRRRGIASGRGSTFQRWPAMQSSSSVKSAIRPLARRWPPWPRQEVANGRKPPASVLHPRDSPTRRRSI